MKTLRKKKEKKTAKGLRTLNPMELKNIKGGGDETQKDIVF